MAVFLNVLAIFSIIFIVANLSLSAIFAVFSQQLLQVEVRSRKRLLWLTVLLPWVIGLSLSAYILQSYHNESILNDFGFPHWHHMDEFAWNSWHGFTVALGSLFFVFVVSKRVIQLRSHKKEVGALLQFAYEKEDGIYQIESDKALAFTTGFKTKQCFVSSGLEQQLSEEEYQVVVAHEKAHSYANDPFKKWLFALLCAFYLKPIAQRLKLHMILAMEQQADNAVIDKGMCKLFVASTLVKVAKLNAENSMLQRNDFIVNFGADVLEQRVYFLLDKLTLAPIHKGLTIGLVLILILISTTSIDGVHHFMETVFSH